MEPPVRRPGPLSKANAFTLPHFKEWALRLTLEDGQPWEIEDFQAEFIEDYFSGRSYAGGQCREFWWIIPEGNTKTTTLAGLGLYIVEHRPKASIPWAASARDQAEIGFRQAEMFVLGSPRLKKLIKCQEGYRRVKNLQTNGIMQIFASDDKTADGIIPTDAFLDELHRHRNLKLYRTFVGKLNKRNGQLAAISTAGEPGSEFEEAREAIRQGADEREQRGCYLRARAGTISLHEWAVPEKGDVEDMDLVKAANPFSGVTVAELREKREGKTMTLSHWRRINCNLATRGENAAITEDEWNAAGRYYQPIPEGQIIDAGLDVAWKWDTTALVPFWACSEEERVFGVPAILEPPRNGSSLDPDLVKGALYDLNARNPIMSLVMDMSRAEDIAGWASSELGLVVIDRAQSNALAVADYDFFMEALRSGWLRQPGHTEFSRQVLNAIAKSLPGGGKRFERQNVTRAQTSELQDRRVIDALTAAAMVHSEYAAKLREPDLAWSAV